MTFLEVLLTDKTNVAILEWLSIKVEPYPIPGSFLKLKISEN